MVITKLTNSFCNIQSKITTPNNFVTLKLNGPLFPHVTKPFYGWNIISYAHPNIHLSIS